jgi:hypothetical protein
MAFTSTSPPRRVPRPRVQPAIAWLLVAALAGDTAAAPLGAARPSRARIAPFARARLAPTALEGACGTHLDGLAAALEAAALRRADAGIAPLPTTHTADAGEIAVLEDDGTFFFPDKDGNPNLDVAATARAFYRTHGDDYDQLAIWLASGLSNWLGSPTARAAAWPVRNDVGGIGLSLFGFNGALGLPGRLQTVLTMNGLHFYPDDPAAEVPGLPNYVTQDVLAHEFGHQWLAYPLVESVGGPGSDLLGRSFQHWSFFFDSDGSFMEGPDWEAVGPDTFRSRPPIVRFGPLDQYLMGVRPPAEVGPLLVLSDAATFTPPGPYVPYSDPDSQLTAVGPATWFAVDDVIAANGPRTPGAAAAPDTLRVGFVLVVPRGSDATPADLEKLEVIRAAFPATVTAATGGRMTVDATLESRPGRLRLHHTRLPDTEAPGVPREVGVRVTVEPGGIPIAVSPTGVALRWRIDPGASWATLPMAAAGVDSFTATLPGQPPGTTLEYAFDAASEPALVVAALPDSASSAPFSYFTGADVTPPVVTHWAQHGQSDERLPQPLFARAVDGLGVDSVWCEFASNGGPLASVPAAAIGADSFLVSIGGGLPRGSTLAYRFVARDASLAGNLGFSNPAFDTLRVGHDHVDGVWNPGPWTHSNVRFNRRDEWRVLELPGVPSGSASWHCGLDSLPYGPYQDAALMSGPVSGIAPGCSLTFAHRYDWEEASPTRAFDGARVEVFAGGAWVPATPAGGYTHSMLLADQGLPQDAPCWSGRQASWRQESVDLAPYAPGPIRVRFRMSTDLFVGGGGWWLDDIRFRFADQSSVSVPAAVHSGVVLGPPWPNPASGPLRQSLRLGSPAPVEWSLHDVAGRRVAALWRGELPAGTRELSASLPRALAAGLYFSRVSVDGRAIASSRIAVVR